MGLMRTAAVGSEWWGQIVGRVGYIVVLVGSLLCICFCVARSIARRRVFWTDGGSKKGRRKLDHLSVGLAAVADPGFGA